MSRTIIVGPQGSGKGFHAEALAKMFGHTVIVDEWDGKTAGRSGENPDIERRDARVPRREQRRLAKAPALPAQRHPVNSVDA